MSALDKLRTQNQTDLTLEGGAVVTVQRVADIFDAILAEEDIPLPVLAELESSESTEESTEETPERTAPERMAFLRASRKRQDWAVRHGVVAIEGEATTIPDDVSLAGLFSTADRRKIADYALWSDAEGEA